MPKTIPSEITLRGQTWGAGARYTIEFMDGPTACHVWTRGPGTTEDIVHRNSPNGTDWRGNPITRHRNSNLSAAKYADIRAAISRLTQADFDKARARVEAEAEAQAAAERAKRDARDLARLQDLADRLGYDLTPKAKG